MRPFKCFKRSVLEMETLAFVLSKDLTKGDSQCMWIPRRHRNRSLRHTVIQMPLNNGFEYLSYPLIRFITGTNTIPIFLLESLIESNLPMCAAIPNQNFAAIRFKLRSRWQDNQRMVSLDKRIQRMAIAEEVSAIG